MDFQSHPDANASGMILQNRTPCGQIWKLVQSISWWIVKIQFERLLMAIQVSVRLENSCRLIKKYSIYQFKDRPQHKWNGFTYSHCYRSPLIYPPHINLLYLLLFREIFLLFPAKCCNSLKPIHFIFSYLSRKQCLFESICCTSFSVSLLFSSLSLVFVPLLLLFFHETSGFF